MELNIEEMNIFRKAFYDKKIVSSAS